MTKRIGNAATLLDEWKSALAEAETAALPVVPPGWITLRQFGEIIERSYAQAGKQMRLLMDNGKAEAKRFLIQTGTVTRPVMHYRLKKK